MIISYGLKFIIAGGLLTVIAILWAAARDSLSLLIISIFLAVITLFLTYFYRNPSRSVPDDETLVLSLADGTVLGIEDIEREYIGGKGKKISIFLSIMDVHINRIPFAGRIDYVEYRPGQFFAAFRDTASEANEQTEIGMEFNGGKMIFKQIAGTLARRIECGLSGDQAVRAGEIFGLIHFGSRAEIFLPPQFEVLVRKGDRVRAGLNAVARIKGE